VAFRRDGLAEFAGDQIDLDLCVPVADPLDEAVGQVRSFIPGA
jgi:hypothetical protein